MSNSADPPSAKPVDQRRADVATLVAEHHAELYRYAYRLTGSVHDAEDLTQQTFLTAQAKLDQLRDVACVRSWLYAIVRNTYLKDRRHEPPTGTLRDFDLDSISLPADDEEIDREKLQRAIDELPDEFKLVLLAFYFEDCSYREIAQKFNLPPGTVMSRLSRAKCHLRARLFEGELASATDTKTIDAK